MEEEKQEKADRLNKWSRDNLKNILISNATLNFLPQQYDYRKTRRAITYTIQNNTEYTIRSLTIEVAISRKDEQGIVRVTHKIEGPFTPGLLYKKINSNIYLKNNEVYMQFESWNLKKINVTPIFD